MSWQIRLFIWWIALDDPPTVGQVEVWSRIRRLGMARYLVLGTVQMIVLTLILVISVCWVVVGNGIWQVGLPILDLKYLVAVAPFVARVYMRWGDNERVFLGIEGRQEADVAC